MQGDRHTLTLCTHALGWVSLLVTAFLVRTRTFDMGWATWIGLAIGAFVFVALITWSGAQILTRVRALDEPGYARRVGRHADGPTSMTWPTARRYGSTTIRRRRNVTRL